MTKKITTGKILPVIKHPNPILRNISEEISLADLKNPEMRQLIDDMKRTMLELDGAGLAAPQVGQNLRLIVVNDEKAKRIITMINPLITKKSWAREIDEEGCLSVVDEEGQNIYGPVSRHKKVNAVYYDELGQKQKIQANPHIARIIQHETDHLDGILFIDRLEKTD